MSKQLTVTAPLVVLKMADGTRQHVYANTPVPEGADSEHVKTLRDLGMLGEAKASKGEKASDKPASVKDVLDEVGDDAEKAASALEQEKARGDDARSTLVEKLEAIANPSS